MGKYSSGLKSSGKISEWANILVGKTPSGQKSGGKISEWAKIPVGKTPSGQVSVGKQSVGKCKWATVLNPVFPYLSPIFN